ncbi:MAG: hypothetical protein R3F62_01400 [Planctomycetota bacterium]
MSRKPEDDRRRKQRRSGEELDPAKFPFGESLKGSDSDRVKFPFGETIDESDEAALGLPGASTAGDARDELVSEDDLDEPTLRTLGLLGSQSGDYADSDLGAIDSDLGALDQSGDVIRDTGEYDPEPFESSAVLPSMPPGSTPADDAAGFDSDQGDLDSDVRDLEDDDYDPMFTPSELGPVSDMGPIGPSGPLVIVDDGAESTRFSASVAGDDSVRIAGARSARRPRSRGRPAPPPDEPSEELVHGAEPSESGGVSGAEGLTASAEEYMASWDDGDLDPDVPVPTLSTRAKREGSGKPPGKKRAPSGRVATARGKSRSARASAAGEVAEEEGRKRSKLPLLLVLLLLGSCGLTVGLEVKRRQDVADLQAAHREELAALNQAHEAALSETRGGLQQALDLAKGEQGELSERLQAVQAKLSEARSALESAQAEQRAELDQERARLQREQAAALEVELAKAVEQALLEEQAEVQARIDAAVEQAHEADAEELERLRGRNAELERALEAEREARQKAEAALERARQGADAGHEGGGEEHAGTDEEDPFGEDYFGDDPFADGGDEGSGDGGGDDSGSELDAFFGDAPASRKKPSGGSELDAFFGGGSSGGGSELDDFFGGGGEVAEEAPPEEEPNAVAEAWETFTEYVHGSLGYRHFSHFSRHGAQKTRNEVSLNVDFDHWYWLKENRTAGLRMVANLEVRADDDHLYGGSYDTFDDENPHRPYLVPNALYGAFLYESFEFRLGYQRFAWGTGDMFNPTDQINPSDYSDLFAGRRIPVFAAAVDLNLQFEFGSVNVELISIPTFTRTRVPPSNTRFDPLAGFPLTVLRPDDPPGDLQSTQWAAKVTLHAKGWDVSLSAYTGFDDLPAGQLATVVIFPPVLQVEPVFDRIHMLGADFATTLAFLDLPGEAGDLLERIQIHGEAAHTFYEGPRGDEILQYVFGINYTFVDLIGEGDLALILEYAGELVTKDAEAMTGSNLGRVLAGAVLLRLQYGFEFQPMQLLQSLSLAVNLALNVNGPENAWLHPELQYGVNDTLSFTLAGDIFYGPDDTFFGQYERDGRVVFSAKLAF